MAMVINGLKVPVADAPQPLNEGQLLGKRFERLISRFVSARWQSVTSRFPDATQIQTC